MKWLLKLFILLFIAVFIFLICGFIQTLRMQGKNLQSQFLAGTVPSSTPNGLYKGSTDFYKGSWQGKKLNTKTQTGINIFSSEGTTSEKYPFLLSHGKGLRENTLDVIKIDYRNEKNPFWLSPLLDEIVEVAPGEYLGKIHYRLIPGYPFTLGYFYLQAPESTMSTSSRRTITP